MPTSSRNSLDKFFTVFLPPRRQRQFSIWRSPNEIYLNFQYFLAPSELENRGTDRFYCDRDTRLGWLYFDSLAQNEVATFFVSNQNEIEVIGRLTAPWMAQPKKTLPRGRAL